ncbi:sugar transferase [Leptothoe spongobia]|uniref:Sugar transferase n=1 Tax=Leptothoe spongobia TAU-MAC 1115 TaxID=1967444 RepID=A0A947GG57_9CYAN|nr:sugar transferase [Leptothoe spongobia]MBT9314725.1 sugar transferase [Leptothoe spongobia TAU-MAC 1115]
MRLSTYSPTSLQVVALSTHCSVYSKRKRCIDILGALLGLSITSILFFPIVLAIKLDTPGPIFYTQQRCGLKGKRFRILKFRSMVTNAEQIKHLVKNEADGHIFKNRNDPRITRVGQFLRKTSLDELPQFFNVLQGDMSLVGTRPPTSDEVEQYSSFHFQRLNIKPGMTGEWQVYGRSNVENFDEIVRMDLNYQRKWSVGYDLLLLLKTIFVVVGKRGAY